MHKKGTLAVVDDQGGAIYRTNSWIGQAIRQLVRQAGRKEELIHLYLENGVYNFYVQSEEGEWICQNYDTGAGETAIPRKYKQQQQRQQQGGHRQAQP